MTIEQLKNKANKLEELIEVDIGSSTMDLVHELVKIRLLLNEAVKGCNHTSEYYNSGKCQICNQQLI